MTQRILKNSMNKANINSFSIHQSYEIKDIVRILDVSSKTVSNWMGKGLVPIVQNSNPLVFTGENIKLFLKQSSKRKRCPLKKHEFWCCHCRKNVGAKEKSIKVIKNRRVALCKECGGRINRFIGKVVANIRDP